MKNFYSNGRGMSFVEDSSHHPIIRNISSLKPGEALLYSLTNKEANKSRLGQHLAKSISKSLNISEPFHFVSFIRSVLNRISNRFLTLCCPRSIDLDRADCTADAKDKQDSRNLSIIENVAFTYFGISLEMFRQKTIETNCEAIIQSIKKQIIMDNDVSDDFLFLFSKKRRSQYGGEDGKHSALGKEKGVALLDPSVVGMTKKEEVVLLKSRSTNSQTSKFAFLLIFICCLFSYAALAQPHRDSVAAATGLGEVKPLQIGDTIPEELWQMPLQVVNHPEGKDTIRLADYRDKKLIILDFWATWCAPCVKSLYTLDTLQNKFLEELSIIPTTYEEGDKASLFFSDRGWGLPSIVAQTALKQYFPHRSIPHQVWIREGKVLAIPMPEYANPLTISDAIRGNPIRILMIEDVSLDKTKPLFIGGNGGDGHEILYYSVFSKRVNARISGASNRTTAGSLNVCFINLSSNNLFMQAFGEHIGMDTRRLIWEVSDSLYRKMKGVDVDKPVGDYRKDSLYFDWLFDNTFCYNFYTTEEMDKTVMQQIIRNDINKYLESYYGVTATIEKRRVSCIVIRYDGTTSLMKAKGGRQTVVNSSSGYRYENALFQSIITEALSGVDPRSLVIDSTLYKGRVDISFPKSIEGNYAKAKKELSKYGLLLSRESIEMDMLIVKETI